MDKQKQTRIKQKVMDMSELCKAKAVGKSPPTNTAKNGRRF
jgi:hypothetical protein